MDPILESKLLGIGTPYSGTNMERNNLIGIIRGMIKENKYTVDYILSYVQSLGYQYQMASDIFQELTGMNPKVIVNNDEYYQNPNFVPAMTLAWGYKKSTKSEAYYVVPFEYGYSVMFKNEKDTPESQFQFISIDEAVNKLKSLVTKVFTINKIITDNCLDKETIQLNSNTVHNVNNPYFSSPLNEMKQAYINKVIDESQFEKKAFQLVAEEKITVKEADDAMKWLDELKKERTEEELEDVEFGNIKNDEKMDVQEENKQLSGSNNFDEVYEEVETSIGDEYADKNKLRMIYFKNKSFLKNLSKEDAAQKLYELYLGFNQDDIKGKDKYVKKNKINSFLKKQSKKSIDEIINNFTPTIKKYEKDDTDEYKSYSFLIKDQNSDFEVWIDVWKNKGQDELHFAWNQDIFDLDNENDRDIQKIQDDNEIFEYCKEIIEKEIETKKLFNKSSSLKKKARNWLVRLEMTKEMNDLEKWVDENGEFDAEQDTPVEFEELVGKFCDKLFTYKDEIAKKIGEDAASEFDDIVTELKYDGPCSTDQFNYMLNDLYDFCDNLSIWLETHGRIEASLKKKAKKFKIMLSIPFGKYHLVDWEAESKEQAEKEFIEANPYYANNKKGIILVDEYEDTFNNNASLKKKAADTDIELDDIEDKDVMKDKIEEINNTDFEELTKEETPQDYLEDESKNEQVMKINEKVGKIIDEFTSKFKDFTKYELQMSSYKLQVLNQGFDNNSLQPIEDTELNAQAILQIILTIAPTEDLENAKKALAIFSINKDKVLFNGTLRTQDGFVAFSEEGLSTIFESEDKENEITEDLI